MLTAAIRGERVMLDAHQAELHGVEVRALNQAVRRNLERFPSDFMFQLTPDEWALLGSQSVILETGPGRFRKFLPYAFSRSLAPLGQ